MNRILLLMCIVSELILASCTTLSRNSSDAQPQLKLLLRLEQSTYHIGQPVIVIIELVNAGSQPTIINSRMSVGLPYFPPPVREIAFNVTDPTGIAYEPDINTTPGPLYNTHFIELKSGEFYETTVHLDVYAYRFLELGNYVIVANYQNSIDPKDAINLNKVDDTRVAWKGELNSNEVLLKIVP